MSFTVTFAAGAFLLAAWVDARLDERRPTTPSRRVAHVVTACVLLQVAAVGGRYLVPDDADPVRQLVAVFALLLPALVYTFVTGIWLVRTLAEVASVRR